MKVSDLEGAELDYWVAKGEEPSRPASIGVSTGVMPGERRCFVTRGNSIASFTPSTDWSQGGPIIDRERIELNPVTLGRWVASASGTDFNADGQTPLVAAMRCFVASKFGDEVE